MSSEDKGNKRGFGFVDPDVDVDPEIKRQKGIHTFNKPNLYPNSILKPGEKYQPVERKLSGRSEAAYKKAVKMNESQVLSRQNTLTTEQKETFLRDRSTSTFVNNINLRRALLTRIAQELTDENLTVPPEAEVSFNDVVLSHEIQPDYNTYKNVAENNKQIAIYKKKKTVDDVSTYLANELSNEEFSKETIFGLLNYCGDREAGASAVAFASVSRPAQFSKSDDMSAMVCDPAAAFTEANLLYLKKNGLLQTTLDETIQKIKAKQSSLSGRAAYALKKIRDYIWTAFMAIVKLNEREPDEFEVYEKKLGGEETGGRRTRRNKRNKRSRKSIKRRSSKKTKRRNSSRRN